jgi:hypothetical protein
MTRHDSGYTPFSGRHSEPPTLELIEMLWRVVGPSGKEIVCGVYRVETGLEVRCHSAESIDTLIRSERATDIDIARDIAAAWKRVAMDKGFTSLDSTERH